MPRSRVRNSKSQSRRKVKQQVKQQDKRQIKQQVKRRTSRKTTGASLKSNSKQPSKADFDLVTTLLKDKIPKLHRFIGVALAGGKTDKTCLSVLEYYPEQEKIFLSRLFDRIKTEGEVSSDLQVLSLINQCQGPVESVSFDCPTTLPHCLMCERTCPGIESCTEPATQWMWKHYHSIKKPKGSKKLFTPYTERCVEQYIESQLEEPFHVQHALGANLAPLTARGQYLIRRLQTPVLEVFPKVSLWRIGLSLHIAKPSLRMHRHWEEGQPSRQAIITRMMDRNLTFIYNEDVKVLVENAHAFDSFLCALTGFLAFKGLCEPRPKGFPRSEGWIQIPQLNLVWG
jgi:hypothetical protein